MLLTRVAAVSLLLATPAWALEGRVVSSQGTPIPDAEVSILGRAGSVRTDQEGRFVWKPAPRPPFEVLVVLPGGRYTKPVYVSQLPESGPLTIQARALHDESVTVTAGTAPGVEAPPASGATLLTGREILARQPANLAQLLENVAGVSTVSEGQAAVPAVRGLARGRTLILIDGARVSAERRVGPSATYLDPFVLEGVEVARGSGSVAYGSDAMGGVIHARSRRAQPGSPFGGRFAGGLGAGIPERRAGLELTKGFEEGGVLVAGHFRDFDDYDGPRGAVFNSGARDYGWLARGDLKLGPGRLSLGWQRDFGRDIERPRNNSSTIRFYYPTEDSHRATLGYTLGPRAGFSQLALTAFFGSYAQVTDQDRFATPARPRSIERADVAAKDFHVRASAERFAGAAKLGFGLDVNGRFGLTALDIGEAYDAQGTLATRTQNVSVASARRTDFGAYLSLDAPLLARLTGSAGLRVDRVETRNQAGFFGLRSTGNGAVSGFAALSAGPFGRVSVTAQVARGFRDPVLSDRYFRGPSGRGFITGNPELDPETSLQLDLALRHATDRWRMAVYAYQYQIDDLIERYQTDPDFFFFRNRGRGRLRGAEVEAQGSLRGGLTLELAAHVMRGELRDDGAPLDDAPPETLSLRLRKEFGERGFAFVRGAAYARDDRPGPTEVEIAGYGLLDAGAGYRLTPKLELRLLGRNLLDKEYLVSPDARAVAAPGRSVLGTLLVSF